MEYKILLIFGLLLTIYGFLLDYKKNDNNKKF